MFKTKKLKVLLLLVLTVFLSYQCAKENETIVDDLNIKTVTNAQALDFLNDLEQNQSQARSVSQPYVTIYDDYIDNAEINNSEEELTVLSAVLTEGEAYTRVLLLNIDGVVESVVYSMYSNNEFSSQEFNGSILIKDLEGNFINGYIVENGLFVAKYVDNTSGSDTSSESTRSTGCQCFSTDCADCELDAVYIESRPSVPLGDLYTSIVPDDVGSPDNEINTGPSVGGGVNGNTCATGQVMDGDGNCVAPEILIDEDFEEEFPCQAEITREVYSNCSPLAQLFQDIFESNDEVNVTFTAENLGTFLEGGRTVVVSIPDEFLIKLNTIRLNQSTELDIINTVVHEYTHAILYHFYFTGGFDLQNNPNPSYTELLIGFANHRSNFGGNHHEYMASLINDISEVTYTWAISNGYDIGDFTDYDTNPNDSVNGLQIFMQNLSWSGLTDTDTHNLLYPPGSLEEQKNQKIIQDEYAPNDAGATPKGNLPNPCD